MKRLRERLCDERGFTLPEMMVTIFMMVVVLFALYGIFDASIRVFAFGNDRLEATQNARLGLERMEREIRAAYRENGEEPLLRDQDDPTQSAFREDQITFQNMQDIGLATITYKLDGNTLTREEIPGSPDPSPIVENVNDLEFAYCATLGDCPPDILISDEADIDLVRISLTVAAGDEGGSQELTTDVYLRNRQ